MSIREEFEKFKLEISRDYSDAFVYNKTDLDKIKKRLDKVEERLTRLDWDGGFFPSPWDGYGDQHRYSPYQLINMMMNYFGLKFKSQSSHTIVKDEKGDKR